LGEEGLAADERRWGGEVLKPEERQRVDALTERIIGCAYTVSNVLGCGFLEKVYENALAHELRRANVSVRQQCPVTIYYDDIVAGEYIADMIVDDAVMIELKAVKELNDVNVAQCLNYLRGTGMHVCLLLNFGRPRVEVRRIVLDL
jgi:GxxExxY protein